MAIGGRRAILRRKRAEDSLHRVLRMLDCAAMNTLYLRHGDHSQPDLPLPPGVHAFGRRQQALQPVDADGPWLLQLCCDRRGTWLTLAEGVRGVHVNGRPVQQMAMLRAGDVLHVDGSELLLYAAANEAPVLPASPASAHEPTRCLRWALRGIGGPYHGRSLSLDKPRRIGSAAQNDICIDGKGIAIEHALIDLDNDQAVLRHANADVLLNGLPVRQAVLRSGDQLVFGGQHRFVLEGPPASAASPVQAASNSDAAPPAAAAPQGWAQRVPWLLLAALLLAAALAALLAFGPR